MKYFTKEWFVKSKGNCDEVKKVVYKYRSYYKQIEPMLPLQLQHVLSDMHDCRLMDLAFDEENCIMSFESAGKYEKPFNLIFSNAQILGLSDDVKANAYWIYDEIYIKEDKYEFRILFDAEVGDGLEPKQLIISADDVKKNY